MFDISLGEMAVIAVVGIIFIGPKEMPVVVRSVARGMKTVRDLAGEIRRAFDGLAEESGLSEASRDIQREMKLIEGQDGKMHKAYDISDFLSPQGEVKTSSASKTEHSTDA
jgi:sec-independent protein translocase protein TatB